MEYTYEVTFAILALLAYGVSEAAEALIGPVLAKYNITDDTLRKAIFITGMTIVNLLFVYFKGLDVVAGLLNEHSTWVTIAMTAFGVTNLGEMFHKFKSRIGRPKTIGEVLSETGAALSEE